MRLEKQRRPSLFIRFCDRFFAFQKIKIHRAFQFETHSLVERHSPGIVFANMKKRNLSLLLYQCDLVPDQRKGITFSKVFGMGANSTDFGERMNMQPLTGHGHQLPVIKNAIIMAKGGCIGVERTRFRECGQVQHLADVFLLQSNRLKPCRQLEFAALENELQTLGHCCELPARWDGNFAWDRVQDVSLWPQGIVELFKPFLVAFVKSNEG